VRKSGLRIAALLTILLLGGSACSRGYGDAILVFAAASLSDVMQAQATDYLEAHGLPADLVRFHFNSSSVCGAQIRQGAPADLFVSADDRIVIGMVHAGSLSPTRYRRLVRNRLVLVIPRTHPSPVRNTADLAGDGYRRFAMGNPESVPAGRYGRLALMAMGVWPAVERRLLRAEHVRQALLYVATGEAEAGLVYASDAIIEPGVEVVERIPERFTPDILYSAAVLTSSRHAAAATSFLEYLASDDAAGTWSRFGFLPLAGSRALRGIPGG